MKLVRSIMLAALIGASGLASAQANISIGGTVVGSNGAISIGYSSGYGYGGYGGYPVYGYPRYYAPAPVYIAPQVVYQPPPVVNYYYYERYDHRADPYRNHQGAVGGTWRQQ